MSLIYLAIILLAGSFAVSVILTYAAKRIATRTGFVAIPTEDRYHRSVIALGGGAAIVATIVSFLIAGLLTVKFLVLPGRLAWLGGSATVYAGEFLKKTGELVIVIICIAVLFVTGLIDDKKRLRAVRETGDSVRGGDCCCGFCGHSR